MLRRISGAERVVDNGEQTKRKLIGRHRPGCDRRRHGQDRPHVIAEMFGDNLRVTRELVVRPLDGFSLERPLARGVVDVTGAEMLAGDDRNGVDAESQTTRREKAVLMVAPSLAPEIAIDNAGTAADVTHLIRCRGREP